MQLELSGQVCLCLYRDLLLCRRDPDNCYVRHSPPSHVWCVQVRLAHDHGYMLGNADITIIAQRPKLSPHKEVMRETLCQLLGAHPSVINIKVIQAQIQICTLDVQAALCHCAASRSLHSRLFFLCWWIS